MCNKNYTSDFTEHYSILQEEQTVNEIIYVYMMEKQGLGKKFNSRCNLLATFVMQTLFHYNAKASTMFLVDSLSELGSLSLIILIHGKG